MQKLFAIFDWDGVIIDSSRQHEQSWVMLARENNLVLPPNFFYRSFGMKNQTIIPNLFNWTQDSVKIQRLSDRKEELYREILGKSGIAPIPGVITFLNRLHAADVPCVIASSTPKPNILFAIDVLGIRSHFDAMVTSEDVSHGKPHPEVFLTAAQKINALVNRSIVFEDAHVGIEAARAASMKVIAVSTTHKAETLGDADRVVSRLDELEIADLVAVLGGE